MHPLHDTIAAVASAPGGAARGIVRLSGPRVRDCLAACFLPSAGFPFELNPKHTCHWERSEETWSGKVLRYAQDDVMEFWERFFSGDYSPHVIPGDAKLEGLPALLPCEVFLWREGQSYTGQAVAEFHTLGSPPLLDALLQILCAHGARLAQPGEFTLRAFLSGRIDLMQAEAVLGAIDAADNREFEAALNQLAGGLSGPLKQLREQLLELLAQLEAGFDFADEEIQFITPEELQTQIHTAEEQVSELLAQLAKRSVSEPVVRVVFVGRPNTGKSSLFNAMIRRTGAIVSPQPGTTRDYLTAEGDLDGVKCVWIDTAGIPSGDDFPGSPLAAAQAASQAARKQHALATVRLICLEAGRPPDDWEQNVLSQAAGSPYLTVLTKIDLLESAKDRPKNNFPAIEGDSPTFHDHCFAMVPEKSGQSQRYSSADSTWSKSGIFPFLPAEAIPTSSVTGEGLEDLRHALRRLLCGAAAPGGAMVPSTATRCRQSLVHASEALHRAREILEHAEGEEWAASEIRSALEALGEVVGAVYTEDLLDNIFSRFCIGK